jgi:hypothetical protein
VHFDQCLLVTAVLGFGAPMSASADDDGNRLRAEPFIFIGTAAQCAPSPAGSRIVTSAWLGGMGLADAASESTRNALHERDDFAPPRLSSPRLAHVEVGRPWRPGQAASRDGTPIHRELD